MLTKATLVSHNYINDTSVAFGGRAMTKGLKTTNHILSVSQQLFSKKGYVATTMKDVCEATGLSRGGLYRHFSSTKDIFLAILDQDLDEDRMSVARAIAAKVPAKIILEHYLLHEKTAIFDENNGFHFAVHEFSFSEKDQKHYFDKRMADAIELIAQLLNYGLITGEFKALDPQVVATHVVYFLAGLKTVSSSLTMTEEMIESQMALIKEMIL